MFPVGPFLRKYFATDRAILKKRCVSNEFPAPVEQGAGNFYAWVWGGWKNSLCKASNFG